MPECPCEKAHGLDEWIRFNAHQKPNATAIVEGDLALSYRQFDILVDNFATSLSQQNIQYEEPICVLTTSGAKNIVAQLAIIRLGATCVPMDVAFPDERIQTLLSNLETRLVITTETLQHRVNNFQTLIIPETLLSEADLNHPVQRRLSFGGDHRSHILHTSGSTGIPKPVEILSRGITRMAFNRSGFIPGPNDRVAHIAAATFDATLLEIWSTLTRGGTVVVLPKHLVASPYSLVESITKYGITGMIMTTALVVHVVSAIPNAFERLDWLIQGGERASPKALQAVLENGAPKALINAYGPTEVTCIVSCHRVTLEDCKSGDIPIGKPVDQTECHVLDDSLQPVPAGEIGALYVSGEGVARGYHGRPEANKKSFVELSGLGNGDAKAKFRVYNTGDLVRRREDGVIEFCGRADNQIKMRGHRIEPGEIETTLLRSGLVKNVTVAPVERKGKDMHIVAFVIPLDSCAVPLEPLAAFMRHSLPDYMIPRIEIVDEIPFTVHGKVDRKLLVSAYVEKADAIERIDALKTSEDDGKQSNWLARLWSSMLGVSIIGEHEDFFKLGGTSLQAAALIVQVRRHYGKQLTMLEVYNNPTLFLLTGIIDRADGTILKVNQGSLTHMLADTMLAHTIPISDKAVPMWNSASEGHVFVTGATGFLGAHVVRGLIDMPSVSTVTCVVRAEDDVLARARIVKALSDYGLGHSHDQDKLIPLAGDISRERFGLSVETWQELSERASAVFHLAAHVNYAQGYAKHRDVNVLGTVRAIELAASGRSKPLYYTSTAAVSGPANYFANVSTVWEKDPPATYQDWIELDIGYTQSKWVSEHLIQDAQSRGLPTILYRPGFLMGATKSGKGNSKDFMARLFLGCIQNGHRPILDNQTKSMVPVDYCAGAMLHIATDSYNFGRTFHLTPQLPSDDLDLEIIWGWLADLGHPLQAVPYKDWLDALSQDPDLLSNPLLPLLSTLQEPVVESLSRWELWSNTTYYDTTNTRNALASWTTQVRSAFTREDLVRHLGDWKEKRLL